MLDEFNTAKKYHEQGNFRTAINLYKELLNIHKNNSNILFLIGMAYESLKETNSAIDFFSKSLESNPNNFHSLNSLGNLFAKKNNNILAIEYLQKAIIINPNFFEAHNNLGNIQKKIRQYDRALESYKNALKINMTNEVLNNIGNTLKELGMFEEALLNYNKALEIDNSSVVSLNGCSIVLNELQRYEEALSFCNTTLKIDKKNLDALVIKGGTLASLDLKVEAKKICEYILSLDKDNPKALLILGLLEYRQGNFDEALNFYNNALKQDKNYLDALWNKALLLLHKGQYNEGWQAYEIRFKRNYSQYRTFIDKKKWTGQNLKEKSILILYEQGFGDTIQFCRFIQNFQNLKPKKVIIDVQPKLKKLILSLKLNFEISFFEKKDTSFDYYVYLLSLPSIFKISLDQVLSSTAYLFAEEKKLLYWKDKLSSRKPKIGITWSGNKSYRSDHLRSIEFELFKKIFSSNLEWHSLQIEYKKSIDMQDFYFFDHSEHLIDFSDTAALIGNLDLVITIDTSVAHLAGALGKPVWILIPFSNDFRWLENRDDSPWYPSARLFRQKNVNDWSEVIFRLKHELNKKFSNPAKL